MLNKSTILFFLFLLFSSNLFSSDQEIEWALSKNAVEYLIEIREFKSKKMKITKKFKPTINKYKIDSLKEGLFEYRIGIRSIKNETVFTDWSSLSIQKSLEPEGAIDEFYFGSLKERYQEIFITGKNFLPDTKIEIYNKELKIPINKIVIRSDTELSFTLDLANAKKGRYDLKIINPLDRVFDRPDFYIIGETFKDAENSAQAVDKADKIKKYNTENKEKASILARSYFLRSAILPGWGQIAAGIDMDSKYKKWRGRVYMATSLITLPYLLYSYKDYRSRKDDLNDLSTLNNLMNQPFNYPLRDPYTNNRFNEDLDALEKSWQTTARVGYFLAGIYVINLIDAYFFTGRKRGIFTVANEENDGIFQAYIVPERNYMGLVGNQVGLIYATRF
jgi:hypothetical protein